MSFTGPQASPLEICFPSATRSLEHTHELETGIDGPAAFLALTQRLRVPVLSAAFNLSTGAGIDQIVAGLGATSLVTRSWQGFGKDPREGSIASSNRSCWHGKAIDKNVMPQRYAIKKLNITADAFIDDAKQLAAIVNEVRILAHPTIREQDEIVRMVCLAWDELPNRGRYWPRMILECATHGSLHAFMRDSPVQLTLDLKLYLSADIATGIEVLHDHRIAHCDLKPDNILIFNVLETSSNTVKHVAKICDFGFSVICTDYEECSMLQLKLGTEPWNAPELTHGHRVQLEYLSRADVFSFGLLLTSILAGDSNFFSGARLTMLHAIKAGSEPKQHCDDFKASLGEPRRSNDFQENVFEAIVPPAIAYDPVQRSTMANIRIKLGLFICLVRSENSEELELAYRLLATEGRHVLNSLTEEPISCDQIPKTLDEDADGNLAGPSLQLEKIEMSFVLHLPPQALKEIFADFYRMASSQSNGISTKRKGVAAYQVAVAHTQGLGVNRDDAECCAWLERSASTGYVVALSTGRSVAAALGASNSPEFAKFYAENLPLVAQQEISRATGLLSLQYEPVLDTLAAKQWIGQDEEAYYAFCDTHDLKVKRALSLLSICLLRSYQETKEPEGKTGPVILKTHDVRQMDILGDENLKDFAEEIKTVDSLEIPTMNGLTLLQHAACLGDTSLARLLIENEKVNIENTGRSGLTPLWIACSMGRWETANFLISRQASLNCVDDDGRNVLHLLSQFPRATKIDDLLSNAVDAGVSVNAADSQGRTPLLATYVGWDYSCGQASSALLRNGADPTIPDKNGWNPILASTAALDLRLLEEMLAVADSLNPLTEGKKRLAGIRGDAFRTLMKTSRFIWMAIGGGDFMQKLRKICFLLLNADALAMFPKSEFSHGTNPLISACYASHDDIVEALLNLELIDINDRDSQNGQTALAWAIERRNSKAIELLLDKGASPLISNKEGYTALHSAAVLWPTYLPGFVKLVHDWLKAHKPEFSIEDALDTIDLHGNTPCGLALFEGTADHIKSAEVLRKGYSLDFDAKTIKIEIGGEEERCSLLGLVIRTASMANLMFFSQIQYLLDLDMKPDFVCGSNGTTLLHMAMHGWQNDRLNDGTVSYGALEAILKKYPDPAFLDLTAGSQQRTALHEAAYATNLTAIEILERHCEGQGVTMKASPTTADGLTPLDVLGGQVMYLVQKGILSQVLDAPLFQTQNRKFIRCYEKLRSLGAMTGAEVEGFYVGLFSQPRDKLPEKEWLDFLKSSSATYGLPYLHDGLPAEQRDTSGVSYVVELCWCYNDWLLRASEMPTSVVEAHKRRRVEERRLFVDDDAFDFPWTRTMYEKKLGTMTVSWKRPGRAWTMVEQAQLLKSLARDWSELVMVEWILKDLGPLVPKAST